MQLEQLLTIAVANAIKIIVAVLIGIIIIEPVVILGSVALIGLATIKLYKWLSNKHT